MSKEQSFSREEVISMLTDLFKETTESLTGCGCSFEWDSNGSCPSDKHRSLYSTLKAQTMSLLESTLDKEKCEPSKIILRQLFQGTVVEEHSSMCSAFKNIITNDDTIGYGEYSGWEKLRKILHQ